MLFRLFWKFSFCLLPVVSQGRTNISCCNLFSCFNTSLGSKYYHCVLCTVLYKIIHTLMTFNWYVILLHFHIYIYICRVFVSEKTYKDKNDIGKTVFSMILKSMIIKIVLGFPKCDWFKCEVQRSYRKNWLLMWKISLFC